MDLAQVLGLTTLFGLLFLIIQRTEPKKRLIVILTFSVIFALIRDWVMSRDAVQEAWVGLGISLVLNFLFWLLIGRYNPVKPSDEMKVLGLDD